MYDFFHDDEIDDFYHLDKRYLSDKTSYLRFVVSRTSGNKQHLTHNEVVAELARKVYKIWEAADCCPAPRQVIARVFQKDICIEVDTMSGFYYFILNSFQNSKFSFIFRA